MLQQICLLNDQILVEGVCNLVDEHHGESWTSRGNDRIHDNAVRCIPIINHDDLSSCSSIHKQTTNENDKRATYKHWNVLSVKASRKCCFVAFKDERNLIISKLFELGVVLSKFLHVFVLYLLLFQFGEVFLLLNLFFLFYFLKLLLALINVWWTFNRKFNRLRSYFFLLFYRSVALFKLLMLNYKLIIAVNIDWLIHKRKFFFDMLLFTWIQLWFFFWSYSKYFKSFKSTLILQFNQTYFILTFNYVWRVLIRHENRNRNFLWHRQELFSVLLF